MASELYMIEIRMKNDYSCSECSRRFFWAIGLRAHSRTHCGLPAPSLACAWPGCDRVFRQPCRLREHTRAHTGDKPYPCRYPVSYGFVYWTFPLYISFTNATNRNILYGRICGCNYSTIYIQSVMSILFPILSKITSHLLLNIQMFHYHGV